MLAAGVPAYDVARYMGTSVPMLDLTYGHLVKGSEDAARSKLDAFALAAVSADEEEGRPVDDERSAIVAQLEEIGRQGHELARLVEQAGRWTKDTPGIPLSTNWRDGSSGRRSTSRARFVLAKSRPRTVRRRRAERPASSC
jgi:hypothetical protein